MSEEQDPIFNPGDLEQYLNETPKPLVIDVEPLRLCSENPELLQREVRRIIEKTLDHICSVLPTLPIGRHLRLVTIRKLPGIVFLQTQRTPWSMGAALLFRGIRNTLVQALQENGILVEDTPENIEKPESPSDPRSLLSLLSLQLTIEDDPDSQLALLPKDAEVAEDGTFSVEDALFFYEKSEFHVYGTKWKDAHPPPSMPWKIPPIDLTKDRY